MFHLFLASTINIDIIYVLLNLILLFVFTVAGINVSCRRSFWGNAFICSIFFIFIVGSRYGRGNDYLHYASVFIHDEDIKQPFFRSINTFFREFLSIGKYAIFYIYAIPFILCGFKFLKNFAIHAKWYFPLFLVSMLYFEEYEIRQALSFSFVFLFLDEFISIDTNGKKIIWCGVWVLLTFSLHSANIFFIICFLGIYYTCKSIISWKIAVPILFFASYFFADYYDISLLQPILNLLSGTNAKFSHYIEGGAAEAWFGDSALQLDNERNPIIKVLDFIAHSSLFYFAYKTLKRRDLVNRQLMLTMTNIYIMGDIARQAFLYLELLNRMSGMFQRMWIFPFAMVMIYNSFYKLKGIERVAYLFMFFLFYDYAKYLFAPPIGMTKFLWDI